MADPKAPPAATAAPDTVPDAQVATEVPKDSTASEAVPAPSTDVTTNPTPPPETAPPTETPKPAEAASETSTSKPDGAKLSLDGVDKSMPEDFDGEVSTTNELPSAEIVKKIENYIVLDRDGKSHTFKSLYSGPNVARRVLAIFVRHFFCGNCQDYLRTLSESITPEMLLRLPVSTFITVIGCGDPSLIETYANDTKCPFPIYTDPKRSLFQAFDMTRTWDAGSRPAYMKKSLAWGAIESFAKALKQIPKGKALKSGNFAQVGGEFLFEPLHIDTPITTPQDEKNKQIQHPALDMAGEQEAVDRHAEEKRITWCHRMKTTRDHAEIPELMEILGLDGQGQPVKDLKLWNRALSQRKGTGLSMASEMNQRAKERS
ncbi:AhpC/TSA antioxidant enzyme-domain-containing protein [Stachybotrys elegans]|uniref:AhpC/TSA antioxidant enzyme-domain-containing protein n=1 Tax=Stachybotrys elegans TaxID=80388 RepID=A0A8K0WWF5_9HYPO|nr:AhpC/TSA antioxidant enzyme-domain-containing protein [Stachybotrys elegans]